MATKEAFRHNQKIWLAQVLEASHVVLTFHLSFFPPQTSKQFNIAADLCVALFNRTTGRLCVTANQAANNCNEITRRTPGFI